MQLVETFNRQISDRALGTSSDVQLIVIDQQLSPLLASLQSQATASTAFLILDDATDGLTQITQALQQQHNIQAIHLFTHGAAGQIQLGNVTLDRTNIDQYTTQLRTWNQALKADADILLYGCEIGAGRVGNQLLQALQQATDADIAASIDLTGNINLGGNWELEAQLGAIGTAAFALTDYAGLLPIYQGHEYVLTTNLSWTASQTEAVRLGGNLVTLNDAAEETWLRQTYGAEKLWIGLTDQVTEGNFQWISGETSAYRNWTPGEPNNAGNEDWVELNFDATGRWNDEKVGATRRGIVEINTAITPPPPSPTPTPPPPSPTPPPPSGTGNGLTAAYYDNADFTNLKLTRVDANVNFNWGAGSPDATIAPDSFSARWSGQVLAQYAEEYTFYTTGDDGIRLSVNGTQIINGWKDQSATEYSGKITLAAGQKYNIQLEYFENGGSAVSQLAWSSTSQTKQIIPQAQLFSTLPPLPPTIALEGSVYTVNETDAKVDIAIVRSGNTQGVSTIDYRADSGTAISGDDFTASSGTVSFAPGETRKIISIPIVDDTLVEGNEAFSFVVQVPTGANLGTLRTATITLFDNESSALTVNPIQVNENIGTAIVTLVRGNSNVAASIDYSTGDGSAIAPGDYLSTIGTVNFAIGETRKTISIPIVNNTTAEVNETFQLNFSNPVALTLTNNSTTITISDDDSTTLIRETVTAGLVQPTAFAWTPGEALMFIAQKNGVVRVSQNNALIGNFIDLSAEVNDVRDRGLLGIAVHPEFYTGKPYVYLAYSYDPPEAKTTGTTLDARDQAGNRAMRVVRITADASNNYRTAVAESEFVIVGKNSTWANISHPELNSTGDYTIAESGRTAASPNAPGGYVNDYIKIDSESHMGGHLAFGADGALYISTGDGTSYNAPDPRTISVQSLDSLSGKILRVDPLTGEGLADNPFYTNDLTSNRAKVWDLGLRNPFRFTIAPGSSTPFIGDVGYFSWEEINVGTKGANFGWPGYEGGYVGSDRYTLSSQVQTNYKNSVPAVATFVNSNPTVTAPIFARNHGSDGAQAIVMGDFFRGELIVTDVNQGTVEALTLNAQNQVTAIRRFDSASVPGIVYMDASLDGGLYYVDLFKGAIGRWKSA